MINYLSRRASAGGTSAVLDECGRRRDLSWVFAESPVLVPELPRSDGRTSTTALVLVRWRRRQAQGVDTSPSCHPHGYWMQWR